MDVDVNAERQYNIASMLCQLLQVDEQSHLAMRTLATRNPRIHQHICCKHWPLCQYIVVPHVKTRTGDKDNLTLDKWRYFRQVGALFEEG